jgi:hypothetical protein
VDFAKAKSIAARRKYGYFSSGNPKNYVFRRASEARPYNSFREAGSLTVWEPTHLGRLLFHFPIKGIELSRGFCYNESV